MSATALINGNFQNLSKNAVHIGNQFSFQKHRAHGKATSVFKDTVHTGKPLHFI